MHTRRPAHHHFVNTVAQIAFPVQDRFDLGGIEGGLRGVDLGLGRLALATARLVDHREHLPDGGRESVLGSHPAYVHEHDPGRIPEKVVVERRDLEAIVESGAHDRIDLVLQEDHVAHDHRMLTEALERGP